MLKKCQKCGYKIAESAVVENNGFYYHWTCREKTYKESIICQICGQEFNIITSPHLRKHGMSMDEYRKLYGRVTSSDYDKVLKRSSQMKKKTTTVSVTQQQDQNGVCVLNKGELELLSSDAIRKLTVIKFGHRINKKDDGIKALVGEINGREQL